MRMQRWLSAFLLAISLASAAPHAAFGACATLDEMATRLQNLRQGTPVRVRSVRGNPHDGVVESVFTSPDGRRVVTIIEQDGRRSHLLMSELDPASFRGPLEGLNEGMEFAVRSRSGNTYRGVFRSMVSDGQGGARILYEENGVLKTLDVSRLDEASVQAGFPHPPRPVVAQGAAPVQSAALPNGQAISLAGDNSFISFQVSGAEARMPGRITRMWNDGGHLRVEIEEINPVSGATQIRELRPDEIASARISTTAKASFAGRAAPNPVAGAYPPPPAPVAPAAASARGGSREIEEALAYVRRNPSAEGVADGLYRYNPSAGGPTPPSLARARAATSTPADTANYLGFRDVRSPFEGMVSGNVGGQEFHTFPMDRHWYRTSFAGNPPAGSVPNPTKVYLGIPLDRMQAELPQIAQAARAAGAAEMKFGTTFADLARPDRIVIHFANPEDAARFARAMAERYQGMGLAGERVPFTHPVGNGPVSMGVDMGGTSWRDFVTRTIARGAQNCPGGAADCISRFLLQNGIDPERWLPTSVAGRITPITTPQ